LGGVGVDVRRRGAGFDVDGLSWVPHYHAAIGHEPRLHRYGK